MIGGARFAVIEALLGAAVTLMGIPPNMQAGAGGAIDGPYVELFARQQWSEWICVGDESRKFNREVA